MTCEQLYTLLSAEFPTTNTDWTGHASVPKPPYAVYLEAKPTNIAADNIVYHSIPRYVVELYIRKNDYVSEGKIESIFNANEKFWLKDKIWNRELQLYQVNYTI